MSTCPSSLTGPARVYRFLLWLYPPGFRLRFGAEMLLVFHDSCRERDARSPTRLDFWTLTLRDLVTSLPGEWWQALAKPRRLELPIGQWADSLVIPFTVLAYVTVEGILGGALVRASAALAWAQGCAVGLTLVVLGILISRVTARSSRAGLWSIKL
ncbi:MAG: hypothetical protein ACLQVG_00415 [Terriglobia bacterium]